MATRQVLVLATVAVVIAVTQAMFPVFQKLREKSYNKRLERVKEKQEELKKRQVNNGGQQCPLWDCYDTAYYDYDDTVKRSHLDYGYDYYSENEIKYLQNVLKCMNEVKAAGQVCNCTMDDIILSAIEDIPTVNTNNVTVRQTSASNKTCSTCLALLPADVSNAQSLPYSCGTSKVDEAQGCFDQITDHSCLTQLSGGIEMPTSYVLDGIRIQIEGCPIQYIIEECMSIFEDNFRIQRDEFTDCSLHTAGLTSSEECVRQLSGGLPACQIMNEEIYAGIADSIQKTIEEQCKPVQGAIATKMSCCSAPSAIPQPIKAQRKRNKQVFLERLLKLKGL